MAYRPYQSKRNEAAQHAIGDALLELLEEKSLSEVNIKELCARAHVSRPTFYRHFDAIEDVLGFYALDIYHRTSEAVWPLLGKGNPGDLIVRQIFREMAAHRAFFQTIRKADLTAPLFGHMWSFMGNPTQNIFMYEAKGSNEARQAFDTITYTWGGTFSLIFAWIIDDMRRTPDEMADAVMHAAQHAGGTFAPNYRDVTALIQRASQWQEQHKK